MTEVTTPRLFLLSSASFRQDSVPQLPALTNNLGGCNRARSEWLAIQEPAGIADTTDMNVETFKRTENLVATHETLSMSILTSFVLKESSDFVEIQHDAETAS